MWRRRQRYSMLVLALLCLLIGRPSYAQVSALVDRSTLTIDDTLSLTIAVEGNSTGAKPDMRELYQDFDIVSTSANSRISIVNGVTKQRMEWWYQLVPLKIGELTIPAIDVNGERTKPLTIAVSEQASQPGQVKRYFIEVEASPERVYVQSQIRIIQRIFAIGRIPSSPRLTEPKLSEGTAEIILLGERLTPYTAVRNGVDYQVIERHFVMYPQKSGPLTIAPSLFEGYVNDTSGQLRFPLDSFQAKRVRARSRSIDLNVLPQPAEFKGQEWLPAQDISIHGNWSVSPDSMQVGEPISLTLGIIAEGLRAEQLPDLSFVLPDYIKVYPEDSTTQNNKNQRSLVGVKNRVFTLIPSAGGSFTFPEITLQWWNTETNQQEIAKLPARSIQVLGDSASVSEESELEADTPVLSDKPQTAVVEKMTGAVEGAREMVNDSQGDFSWWRLFIALLALILLAVATWLLFFYRGVTANSYKMGDAQPSAQSSSDTSSTIIKKHPSLQESLSGLKKACEANNAKQAAYYLQYWSRATIGNRKITLASIAQLGDPQLKRAVDGLSVALYSKKPQKWRGELLWKAVSNFKPEAKKESRKKADLLEPMYR